VIEAKGAGQADIAPNVKLLSPDDHEKCYANEGIERRQSSDDETVYGIEVAVSEKEEQSGQHSEEEKSAKENNHRLALFQAFLKRINCLM
jgi:hypothetical protein